MNLARGASMSALTPARALIFRLVHIANVPWILDHGLHCRTSGELDPNYVEIGSQDLIGKRMQREVPIPPGGSLGDYVPFYFTPCSPMLLNIKTGRNVPRREAHELVHLVTSLLALESHGARFVFTDRHAFLAAARFFDQLQDLDKVDWPILQARDFKRSVNDPEKMERYQAEALVHRHVPIEVVSHIVCARAAEEATLADEVRRRDLPIKVACKPGWFFQ